MATFLFGYKLLQISGCLSGGRCYTYIIKTKHGENVMKSIKTEFVAYDTVENKAKSFSDARKLSIFFLARRFMRYSTFYKITYQENDVRVYPIDLITCSGDISEIEKIAQRVEDDALLIELGV